MDFKEELAKKAGQTPEKSGENKVDSLPADYKQGADQPLEKKPSIGRFSENSFMGNGYIRPLRADEIECRVAAINEKGLSLLLYKDARVDQRILDETFGPFGWKRSHQCIDGNLYCTTEERTGILSSTKNLADILEGMPDVVDSFDEGAWYALVDYVTVYGKDDVRFTFKNGIEIKA